MMVEQSLLNRAARALRGVPLVESDDFGIKTRSLSATIDDDIFVAAEDDLVWRPDGTPIRKGSSIKVNLPTGQAVARYDLEKRRVTGPFLVIASNQAIFSRQAEHKTPASAKQQRKTDKGTL